MMQRKYINVKSEFAFKLRKSSFGIDGTSYLGHYCHPRQGLCMKRHVAQVGGESLKRPYIVRETLRDRLPNYVLIIIPYSLYNQKLLQKVILHVVSIVFT